MITKAHKQKSSSRKDKAKNVEEWSINSKVSFGGEGKDSNRKAYTEGEASCLKYDDLLSALACDRYEPACRESERRKQ